MKSPKISLPGLLAATIAASVASVPASAQNTPVTVVPQRATDAEQWQQIRLRNVAPDFMAYWLDAKNHSVFPNQQGAKPTWTIGKTEAEVKAMLSLPAGVRALAPVDATNSLWVLGTPEGLQQIAEKIALLDRPLRQVEVEAQVVQISPADAKTLGINFSKKEGKIEIGMAGVDIQQKIEALVAQKKAKTITAPRVTAIFGAQSTLSSMTIVTTLVTIKTINGSIKVRDWTKQDRIEDQIGLPISTTIQLAVTPNLNPDGSIALAMGPLRTLGISGLMIGRPENSGRILNARAMLKDLDDIPSQPIVVQDNQTAVLQGLQWNNGIFDDSRKPATNVIVLLRARRIFRAGDEEGRPVSFTR